MICLSLRISGEKSTERSKLMDQRVDDIKSVVKLIDNSSEIKWLADIMNVNTLKDQIAVVSSVFQDEVAHQNESSLNSLMELYLKLPHSNPLKKYILSSYSEFNEEQLNILMNVVISVLNNRFSGTRSYEDADELVSILSCINLCYNQNSEAFTSLLAHCSVIFISVKDMISSCSFILSDSTMSPVFKEKLLKNIHCLTQSIITFLHKVTSDCIPDVFLKFCLEFLSNDDLPLNTKTNLAIIIAMINQMSCTYSWEELITKYLSSAPITVVSLCSGIFSAVTESLWESLDSGLTLADYILDHLLILEEKNSSDCKLVLGVCRGINQYCKACLCSSLRPPAAATLDKVLVYLLAHLEHPMDAVRHLASDSLSNLVSFASKYPESGLINQIVEEVIRIPLYRRSKYVILSSLVGHVPVETIFKKVPNLVEILLLSVKESSGAKHVVVSFEMLLSQHFIELEDTSKWLGTWVDPLVISLNHECTPILEQILSKIIKLNPTVIDYIFGLDDKLYSNKIRIILLSLSVGQKVGILKGDSEVKWKGFIDYSFLESCLHHREQEARLSLFALIVDSPKSSELFTINEIKLVKTFFQYNMNCQSASFRQSFIALFKKFLIRLNDSHHHGKCKIENLETKIFLDLLNHQSHKGKTERACPYLIFLDWLVVFCCNQLFPGSSFSRRSTVLSMLSIIVSCELFDKDVFTKKMVQRLLYILQVDTYEDNKILAKTIIQKLNFDLLCLDNEKLIYDAFSDCLSFASSIRPPDCISAAYCLSSLLKFEEVIQAFCELAKNAEDLQKNNVKELGLYYCLSLIIDDLTLKADIASRNIHQAAKEGPMYGLLFLIRHILQDVNLREVSNDKCWVGLIKKLIDIGVQCTNSVSCIVNNSSPEGHLPMDLSLDFSSLTLADGTHQVTSQLLLLCSWRTVKEVCLLFGEIVEKINISEDNEDEYFSEKDVLAIGEHLTTLLSEIKHRGAFEQAYIGFCKLAATLWKYPKGHLHQLPSIWLKETLDEIVSSKSKLCATRRSAGIPFIIQALVVTEREVLGGKQLGWTVQRVLELGNSSTETWETRVHAMNILRSLYRSSHLGEAVSPFVAQGFIISFKGFSGKTWPERNSATLLFSALITRVFGVNRSRSHCLSWKNKMTGRIFFQRYPELYSIILNKLQVCSETDIHSVFPVLLLLGRLYPSSLEGSDSNLRLENMVPFIMKYGTSSIMKIRSLAASALVGLIYPFNICDQINSTLGNINPSTAENSVHGYLLQVFHLLKFGPEIPKDCGFELNSLINNWFKTVITILKSNKHSLISQSTCLYILLQLMFKYFKLINEDSIAVLTNYITDRLLTHNIVNDYRAIGFSEFLVNCSRSLIFISFNSCKEDFIEKTLVDLLKHSNYDVYQITLEFINRVLTWSETCKNNELNQYFGYFNENSVRSIQNIIKSCDPLHSVLIEKLKSGLVYHEDSLKLLSVVKELPILIKILFDSKIDVFTILNNYDSSDSLKACVIKCISSYLPLKESNLSDNEVNSLCTLITEGAKSDFDCRMAVTELLVNNYQTLVSVYPRIVVFTAANAIIRLICDDCEEIRLKMSDIVFEMVDSMLALEMCIELINKLFGNNHLSVCIMTAWAIGAFCEEQYTLEESDKAFDRGDMNSYKEDLILTTTVFNNMKKIFNEYPELLDREIPSVVLIWMNDYVNFSTCYNTLRQLLSSFKEYTEGLSKSYQGKYLYFINFSTAFKNYSLLSEKYDIINLI